MTNRMFHRVFVVAVSALLVVAVVSAQGPAASAPAAASVDKPPATQRAIVDKYCVGCHNARVKSGGLMLDSLDLSRLWDHAEIA